MAERKKKRRAKEENGSLDCVNMCPMQVMIIFVNFFFFSYPTFLLIKTTTKFSNMIGYHLPDLSTNGMHLAFSGTV